MVVEIMELGAIGELVGGVAVIASLIFVGLQVRQNTQTMRSQTQFESARHWSTEISRVAYSPDMARIVRLGSTDIDALSPEERERFCPWFVAKQFFMIEAFFYQYQQGIMPPETWRPHERILAGLLRIDAAMEWWRSRLSPFSAPFEIYVNNLIEAGLEDDPLDLRKLEELA